VASTPVPTLTIRKVIANPCVLGPAITGTFIQGVPSQWHFNWNTVNKDTGVFLIQVNLGDNGDPNPPYIWVRLQ
jgi:hypothetical protein